MSAALVNGREIIPELIKQYLFISVSAKIKADQRLGHIEFLSLQSIKSNKVSNYARLIISKND